MTALALPQLSTANADFVTPQLAVGGDLDRRALAALEQLLELAEAGMTHIVDVRLEANDEDFVQRFAAAAVLLGQGWDAVEALSAIRGARPIAYIDYADDALAWYHARVGGDSADLLRDVRRVAQWRRDNYLDASTVIRQVRAGELRRLS